MGIYRKTTPSSYQNTPASNFTDSSKNWRKHKNMYRRTSDNETASLTTVPGRYTDDTRSWRRIRALYRFTSSGTWQKIFGKFAGQPYPETSASIRYDSYTGTVVGDFAEMGPGSTSIAQGSTATTFLWGRDGQDWQNIETLASRSRTFVQASTPVAETAQPITNDEGNFDGDKLRNSESVILQYDGKYVWYRDRITLSNGSTGTSYSQPVRIIKQQPVINNLAFKTNNDVSAGERKDVSFSIANQWYRSIDKTNSMFRWYILDSQYETPTQSKLWNSTSVSSVILTENTTVLTGEDFFTIPTTFGGVSTTGKWLHVELRLKNSSSDTDLDYALAPYNDVTDYVVAQIGASMPSFTYSLTNISSVTTPSAPVQQRVSATSNTVLIEMSSSFPSDTESYELWSYGAGSSAGGTLADPSVQTVSTLNQYNSSGNFVPTGGSFDTVTNISSTASNSPISTFTKAIGTSRALRFNVSSTSGAQSWKINYTISGASSGNGTFALNTNSMPASITISGAANPTVTITGVTAYSDLNQMGATKAGTAGSQVSLSTITKPVAFSTTSTSNYTFYTNVQVTGSQRRITLPSAFTSGTNIYVSTNGYINWGGIEEQSDPFGSVTIPSFNKSGITIAPLNGDLRQGAVSATSNTSTGGLWVFADATNYWVTWWGNYYTDATQVARYQVKFYWNQSYADVYIVNNSLTTITPSIVAVQNGATVSQSWSSTTAQTSTLLPTASMNRISTQDGVDDNRTLIAAIASQPPTGGTTTVSPSSGAVGTAFSAETSGWSGAQPITFGYQWQALNRFGFYWETLSTASTFTPTEAQRSNALSFRLVLTASNGISPNGTTLTSFSVTQAAVIPTISMLANSGISQTAGTINWSSTNQNTWSSTGTFSGSGSSEKTLSKTALVAGTTYTGTVTVTSVTGNTASANYSLTTTAAASVPVNISVPTLSGGLAVGTTFTFGVGQWLGSPTSYDLRLYRGTAFVATSETLVKSAGNVTSSTYVIPPSDFNDSNNRKYYRAFATATNAAGTSNNGTFTAGEELGPITSAPATPAPVLSTITGDNSLVLGGTFSWSFTNSPTAYSVFCTGPTGTVFTTSNAYSYSGTTFRPGYDGNGWQGPGDYTIYVSARNAGGDSAVASFTKSMS
jgi:hypothetical protein